MTFPFSTLHLYTKMSKGLACQVPRSSSWSYTPRCMVLVIKATRAWCVCSLCPQGPLCTILPTQRQTGCFPVHLHIAHTHTTCTHADTHTHTHTQTGHVWPVGCILVPPGLQDGNKASPKNVRTLSVVIACAWVHVQYSTNSWIISIQPVGCTYRIYWQCVCCVYNISLMFKLHGKA